MTVINNTILLVRRIKDLQRRRDILVERQETVRRALPDWAFAPLQLAGMSAAEIRSAMSDLGRAESEAGLDDLDDQIVALDNQIEELENVLLTTPARSIDCAQAVLDLAIGRFRAQTSTDPADVFFDYGDARVLRFLERAAEDFRVIMGEEQRIAV
ncbi:MAG: hypothetical protein KDE35_00905 [Geminicoccaceae bacterium]|nr:hypothetical protein [Geminicoccaceae bacterium]